MPIGKKARVEQISDAHVINWGGAQKCDAHNTIWDGAQKCDACTQVGVVHCTPCKKWAVLDASVLTNRGV